jgi:biopolymer transport protein ExbD
MRFFVRKRRQTPTVIIVALIDVLIVLLIFLVVTTTFKQHLPAFQLSLPESTQAQRLGGDENAPLIISLDAAGNVRFGPEQVPVSDDRLKSELQERIAANPELRVAVSMDKEAPVGRFLAVRDAAIEARVRGLVIFARETPPRE